MEELGIIAGNKNQSLDEFKELMSNTDNFLNAQAQKDEKLYQANDGKKLEKLVYQALCNCAIGTSFEDNIELVSGHCFPDIVAQGYYGVEVKSTVSNHWTSIGSSILESTRKEGVERIYLTFGKLGSPVEFLSRPYHQCMEDIAVTHYPRYKINMKLNEGETIFDKMQMSYEEIRKLDNPVAPVAEYYKSQLNKGETLWWIGENIEDEGLSPKIRIWNHDTIDPKEQKDLIVFGCVFFPEIYAGNYDRFAVWLVRTLGIICHHVRDFFSASGQKQDHIFQGQYVKLPAVFKRIEKYKTEIVQKIYSANSETLKEYWQVPIIEENRLKQWCSLVEDNHRRKRDNISTRVDVEIIHDFLCKSFF